MVGVELGPSAPRCLAWHGEAATAAASGSLRAPPAWDWRGSERRSSAPLRRTDLARVLVVEQRRRPGRHQQLVLRLEREGHRLHGRVEGEDEAVALGRALVPVVLRGARARSQSSASSTDGSSAAHSARRATHRAACAGVPNCSKRVREPGEQGRGRGRLTLTLTATWRSTVSCRRSASSITGCGSCSHRSVLQEHNQGQQDRHGSTSAGFRARPAGAKVHDWGELARQNVSRVPCTQKDRRDDQRVCEQAAAAVLCRTSGKCR